MFRSGHVGPLKWDSKKARFPQRRQSVLCWRFDIREVRMRRIAAASFAIILVAPSAAEAASAIVQAPCLRQDMVKGWKVLDDNTLIVTDRVDEKFRLSLAGACHDLQF
jgi:hypothetical protein